MSREAFEQNLELEAEKWNHAPFLFRGYTHRGADCIGLCVGILRKVGMQLPDDDGGLYEKDWFNHDRKRNRYLEGWLKFGKLTDEPKPGDIVLFWSRTLKDKVTHSGIYLGGDRVVHARPPEVKIESLKELPLKKSKVSFIRLFEVEKRV